MMDLRLRRKLTNYFALSLSMMAVAFGLFWLFWLLTSVFKMGVGGLTLSLFTKMTPPPGSDGGLLNAIVGSLIQIGLATLIGTPFGVLSGVYLAEYGAHTRLGKTTLFINDILLSAPSIVVGLVVYAVYVAPVGHFSALAGIFALALLVIPVVIRTTENMLVLVPDSLREAVFALGTPKWKVITKVTLRASLAGIVTGVLLAVARVAGETAPLLFTSLSNQFWTLDLNKPMATLPVIIFNFAMSPYADWQRMAWSGVLLITFGVLALNILARVLFRTKHKH